MRIEQFYANECCMAKVAHPIFCDTNTTGRVGWLSIVHAKEHTMLQSRAQVGPAKSGFFS